MVLMERTGGASTTVLLHFESGEEDDLQGYLLHCESYCSLLSFLPFWELPMVRMERTGGASTTVLLHFEIGEEDDLQGYLLPCELYCSLLSFLPFWELPNELI